jgi:hypothetical protein
MNFIFLISYLFFDVIVNSYVPLQILDVFAIIFLWEEELWQQLLSRRGNGTTWTVPVCFQQAVVENSSFISRMFWFLCYREFKYTGELGQCEKALLWEQKQVRCYFITHFFSEHLPLSCSESGNIVYKNWHFQHLSPDCHVLKMYWSFSGCSKSISLCRR